MRVRARRRSTARLFALLLTSAGTLCAAAPAESPDTRAARIEAQMTDAERMSLLVGILAMPIPGSTFVMPEGVPITAGHVPGVPRLGIPAQLATDASLGIANPLQLRKGDVATAMPSGQVLAASFDRALAEKVGATLGREARAKGFNILLGGGMNLAYDPRNGRNFEYLGEDPLLAGTLAGHAIRGTQSQGVVSTIKHFALNGQETLRHTADSVMTEAGLREGELLGFQIGIEIGQPGSVMCAYNLVNGHKACGNDSLLNTVLKRDWGYRGWVMSDWGAVNDAAYFNAGLDQQAGSQLDPKVWFGEPLRAQIESGAVPRARLSDAVRRMLRSLYAVGIESAYVPQPIDYAANAQVALEAARAGLVLLTNDGVLPIAPATQRILVVGGSADFGVLSGGGSSQVTPSNGAFRLIEPGGDGILALFARQMYFPGSPLRALRAAMPKSEITFQSGYSAEAAAAHAAHADLVIVFATKWEGEGQDSGSLSLPQGQDLLIAQLAAANRNVVVVLETGNPVTMPWLGQVRAVLQAGYPGQEGGQAIADILTGAVNPSGRLPVTYPTSLDQNPRRELPGFGLPVRTAVRVPYNEGSNLGYRAFAQSGATPLFAFGHGLSYTRFSHTGLTVKRGATLQLSVTVRNDGDREGADVPQLYLLRRNGSTLQRLVGFERVTLAPGESRRITMTVDPRLLADFRDGGWSVPRGRYEFTVARSAVELGERVEVTLAAARLPP
jgi:beta-glucosidase